MSTTSEWGRVPFGRAPGTRPSGSLSGYADTVKGLADTLLKEIHRYRPDLSDDDEEGLWASWMVQSWQRPNISAANFCAWEEWGQELEGRMDEEEVAIIASLDRLMEGANTAMGPLLVPLRLNLLQYFKDIRREMGNLLWSFVAKRTGGEFLHMQKGLRRPPRLEVFDALDETAQRLADELDGSQLVCGGPPAVTATRPDLAPNDAAATAETPALSVQEYEALHALHDLGASGPDSRKNADEVAIKARGPGTPLGAYKHPLAKLVSGGFIKSKKGSGGGYWLLPTGTAIATKLAAK